MLMIPASNKIRSQWRFFFCRTRSVNCTMCMVYFLIRKDSLKIENNQNKYSHRLKLAISQISLKTSDALKTYFKPCLIPSKTRKYWWPKPAAQLNDLPNFNPNIHNLQLDLDSTHTRNKRFFSPNFSLSRGPAANTCPRRHLRFSCLRKGG